MNTKLKLSVKRLTDIFKQETYNIEHPFSFWLIVSGVEGSVVACSAVPFAVIVVGHEVEEVWRGVENWSAQFIEILPLYSISCCTNTKIGSK